MREPVLRYIREGDLLHAGDRLGAAVSGGADSVALLRILLELRAQLGIVLIVAHFNHQLRGEESDADERFVAELARHHDLPFFAGRDDVRQYAERGKLSLEHAARELRYLWLTQLARREKLDAIATGHTLDDQAETVLMKFLRGAGTRGLAGIHPILKRENVRIIRPLLETSRDEIEAYLQACEQPWREDRTNLDMQHTRNRIRHELLPLLERDYNPNLRELLSETAEVAVAEEDYWQRVAETFLDRWHKEPGRLLLYRFFCLPGGLLIEPVAMQRRVLKCFLESRGVATDFHHVELVRQCAVGKSPAVGLPGGWLASRKGDFLELTLTPDRAAEGIQRYEYFLRTPGNLLIPELNLTLQATVIAHEAAAKEPPRSLLRLVRFGAHLTVRNWRPGDRFRPAHSGSEEKLKRLFSEKHVPAEQRRLWPVVLHRRQIVWVRGFPVAHDFAWVPGSGDALRIEALPCECAPAATQPPRSVSK
ncbi:MAG TPA: tRNA lysidine(34) synthetase TilS [Candidatus Eisenbacteria bacterium]|nr:tRNA lysidine(34) synthetase TilS [Candidatus Eisenbacteria bacterium]